MGQLDCVLHCNNSLKRTFVHLTFNQVVAGSIPARPTNKSITYECLKKAVVRFKPDCSIQLVLIGTGTGFDLDSTDCRAPCLKHSSVQSQSSPIESMVAPYRSLGASYGIHTIRFFTYATGTKPKGGDDVYHHDRVVPE